MRKTFLLIPLGAMFVVSAAAQSGRRGITPPPLPPPERLSEPPVVSPAERASVAPAQLSVLPESVLKRQLKALDKGTFSLAAFGGKVLVVNLWASWCGPCRREVPEYEKVRKELAGRGVEFIGLTAEDPRTSSERVKQFARDFNFGFRLGWVDHETAAALMNGRGRDSADPSHHSRWTHTQPLARLLAGQAGNHLRETIERALSEASPSAQR